MLIISSLSTIIPFNVINIMMKMYIVLINNLSKKGISTFKNNSLNVIIVPHKKLNNIVAIECIIKKTPLYVPSDPVTDS